MFKSILRIVLCTVLSASWCSTTYAGLVTTLNTGIDSAGGLLADGSLDTDYALFVSADPGLTSPNMFVTSSTDGFPFFPGGWFDNGPNSKWIVPYTNGLINASSVSPVGTYIYRTTFDLTGYDPTSATISGSWAVDERGTDIVLNGIATGQTTLDPGFTSFSSFSITSGFVAGVNTLDFVIGQNPQPTGNPIGIRVEGQVNATAVPEPSALALIGLVMPLWRVRRKRNKLACVA